MRVALMTWFNYHNYGTALQVFALTRIIKRLENEVSVINYDPSKRKPICVHRNSIFSDFIKMGCNRLSDHFYQRYKAIDRENKFDDFLATLQFTQQCDLMSDRPMAAPSRVPPLRSGGNLREKIGLPAGRPDFSVFS